MRTLHSCYYLQPVLLGQQPDLKILLQEEVNFAMKWVDDEIVSGE
jgi:hypothetical protein